MRLSLYVFLAALPWFSGGARAGVVLSEGTNISVDAASDGRVAIDLLGGVWIIPQYGGEAHAITGDLFPATRPRWSPDDSTLVYQASTAERPGLRLYRFDDGSDISLSSRRYSDQYADWHPGGERIVFSSARNDDGFDIWELDLETRLAWRLTHQPGNETEPAWSNDGRNLTYVHEHEGRWSLMLRRHGEPDEVLAVADAPLAAPAWRPDGSLITYLKLGDNGWSVWMTILSQPRLHRTLIDGEDFFIAPIAWLDRQRMLYAANGHIRERFFDARRSTDLPFRASIGRMSAYATSSPTTRRELPQLDAPGTRTIIRASRLFDGRGNSYRHDADIIIDGGRITAIESHADRDDGILIDLGDVTVLPGFVDAYATLPQNANTSLGPLLLGFGVTTIVAEHERAQELNATWSGRLLPGPRVLPATSLGNLQAAGDLPWLVTVSGDRAAGVAQRAAVQGLKAQGVAVLADSWQVSLGSGATMLLASDAWPTSPGGRRYQDVQLANGPDEITLVSGLADAMTPHIEDIWSSRPAALIASHRELTRRFSRMPDLSAASGKLVLGSRPNGLPPGIALHAELRAMIAAGLSTEQALKAAGINSAVAFGLDLGQVATGAAADLVIVGGDPLARIEDALKIIAVVRNGRFFSLSGLLDRVATADNVE